MILYMAEETKGGEGDATGNMQQAAGSRQQVQQYFVDVIPSGSYLVKENSSEASARTFDQKESEAWRSVT